MTPNETNDDDFCFYDWLMDCASGEARTWTDTDGNAFALDRRPVVVVQSADGAGAVQTINLGRTTDAAVIQADRKFMDMTIGDLVAKAPPHSDTCAFRDYMAMIQTAIHEAAKFQ